MQALGCCLCVYVHLYKYMLRKLSKYVRKCLSTAVSECESTDACCVSHDVFIINGTCGFLSSRSGFPDGEALLHFVRMPP